MDRLVPGLIIAGIVVVLFSMMWRSWRRRTVRDANHGLVPVPAHFAPTDTFDVQYVATTRAGEPLERLALPGLGFRGFGTLSIMSVGASLAVAGERPAFLPAESLRSVHTSQVAIDRVVEPDGLVCISWTLLDGTECDSYVRLREPADQPRTLAAISDLIPTDRARSDFESESNA
ncbi:hypothetical protein [Paramicrobacterium chengjingii]|uniref:PH domain-containing protein n=1 Tax=Paramicrobacterium chengjingii TaxID=2769067 RepID=A0ABX6YNY5_9MICO|nr:hypothetical protein [Microbacterium chengjingii]QPZ39992.1 hypothetical protein HCR76_08260 [Microbacterium chengjingii]